MTGRAWIDEGLRQAKEVASDLQPWPDYFDFKAEELKTILDFYEFSGADSILEIGCGNGFTSCLLSRKAGRVEAFDLPAKEASSHSVGISTAEELAARMRAGNVTVRGGSVVDMPYGDHSFRAVFSQYMLQYVGDKRKALAEMRRVLADDGVMITVVPNFIERILVPIIRCEYMIGRLIARIADRSGAEAPGAARAHAAAADPGKTRKGSGVAKALNDYLLLRPDGAYRTYMEELLSHRPSSWKRLLEENGFEVKGIFSTQMLPLGLFELLGPPATRLLSRKINSLTRAVGNLPILRKMGYSIGFIAVKGAAR